MLKNTLYQIVVCLIVNLNAVHSFNSNKVRDQRSTVSRESSKIRVSQKPYQLTVLVITNGYDLTNSSCHERTVKLLVDTIRSKRDILPEYELNFRVTSSLIGDGFTPQLVLDFLNERLGQKNIIKAPLFVGPSHTNCSGLGSVSRRAAFMGLLQNYNMARIFGVRRCADVDRMDGATFFKGIPPKLKQSPSERIFFTTQFTIFQSFLVKANRLHNWKEVAVFMDSFLNAFTGVSGSYEIIHTLAVFDIRVVAFEFGNNYLEMFRSIKNSKARIILLAMTNSNCIPCFNIWCSAYKAGIRPPHYVLLIPYVVCLLCLNENYPVGVAYAYVDGRPSENCNKTIQMEQAKMALFSDVLGSMYPKERVPEFNNVAGSFIEPAVRTDLKTLSTTLQKSACPVFTDGVSDLYKSLLATVWTLNRTEEVLRSNYNTTLRNFIPGQNLQSDSVIQVMSDIAKETEFRGTTWASTYDDFHYHYIMQAEYLTRLDANRITVGHVKPRFIAKIMPFDGEIFLKNISQHKLIYLDAPIWATQAGNAPNDLSQVMHRDGTYSLSSVIVISSLAAISLMAQLTAAAILLKFRDRNLYQRPPLYIDYGLGLFLLTGCAFLNISVVVVMTGNAYFLRQLCYWRPVLTILGLAMTNGVIIGIVRTMVTFSFLNRHVDHKVRTSFSFNAGFYEKQREIGLQILSGKIQLIVKAFIAVSVMAISIWLTSAPITVKTELAHANEPLFDEELDSYYDIIVKSCYSASQTYWMAAFTIIHGGLLVYSCVQMFAQKGKCKRVIRHRYSSEITKIQLLTVNATIIFMFTVISTVIFHPATPSLHFHLQVTLFSVGQLLYSCSTTTIYFYPLLSAILKAR